MRPGRGGMILTFGILGVVICIIFGIMAWVMGKADLAEMDAGRMNPADRGLTQAGYILGIISVCLAVLGLVIAIVIIAGGAAAM